ncbi:unnamed protein product [Amaranthus hypochondriacus]
MASENTKPEIPTPMPTNPPNSRRSRPRVREVSSRFMSPVAKPPSIIPSTPSDSHISRNHSLRRSNTDFRPPQSRYADENQPDRINRNSVSPVRTTSKPRAAVKLFKEGSRTDTPVPVGTVQRLVRNRSWDTAAAKLLQSGGIVANEIDRDNDDGTNSVDSDCESVKSEQVNHFINGYNNNGGRGSTPCSKSMEFSFSAHEVPQTVKGGQMNKVARSLNLPPMPPTIGGCSRVEGKKVGVKKVGSCQQDDVHRFKLFHNRYLQWRFANAKAEACLKSQKMHSEKQLYSLVVKISELQDSVKSKRVELALLKEAKALSAVLDAQMPCLDEWSSLEEAYSSSLLELTQGLQNISSRLPLIGNVKADVKEINEAMNSALKVAESIGLQVQEFMPKAEQVDVLVSDLARVHNGEITLVHECGDLLYKTHTSQIEECSLRGQLMQFQKCSFNRSQEVQT